MSKQVIPSPSEVLMSSPNNDDHTGIEDRPANQTTRTARWIGAIPIVIILGVMVTFAAGALDLGLGTFDTPGPGLWPFLASIITIPMVVMLLIRGSSWDLITRQEAKGPIILMATLFLYFVLLNLIGYIVATMVTVVLTVQIVGRTKWWKAIIAAVAISIGSYVLFTLILGVPSLEPGFF